MALPDALSLGTHKEKQVMSKVKTIAVAAALLIGASSLAMAQSTSGNAAASGGPGTHAGAMKSGSASNSQKVEKNQNGYSGGHQ
jgi:Spy/CpxP family protein refolding chaperone